MKFQAIIATDFHALTCFMNISYVIDHKTREQSLISIYSVYSLSTDILIWMCDIGFIIECGLVCEDFESSFPFQNLYVDVCQKL
jgi:hypothetical protein